MRIAHHHTVSPLTSCTKQLTPLRAPTACMAVRKHQAKASDSSAQPAPPKPKAKKPPATYYLRRSVGRKANGEQVQRRQGRRQQAQTQTVQQQEPEAVQALKEQQQGQGEQQQQEEQAGEEDGMQWLDAWERSAEVLSLSTESEPPVAAVPDTAPPPPSSKPSKHVKAAAAPSKKRAAKQQERSKNTGPARVRTREEQDRLLTAGISQADSLSAMQQLLDKHGASMNVIHITAFLSRLPKLLQERYSINPTSLNPSKEHSLSASTTPSSATDPAIPAEHILLPPPEAPAAFDSATISRDDPLPPILSPSMLVQTVDTAQHNGEGGGEHQGIVEQQQQAEQQQQQATVETERRVRSTRDRAARVLQRPPPASDPPFPQGRGDLSDMQGVSQNGVKEDVTHKSGGAAWQGAPFEEARELARAALLLLQPLILEVDGRGIANVLHALACLELPDADIIDDLLYLSLEYLPTLSNQAYSNIIYSLACLGVRPQRQWSIAFFRHSLPLLPSFSLQSKSNTLWALARLRLSPRASGYNKDWDSAMFNALHASLTQPASAKHASPQALSNLTWAIASLDLNPPFALRAVLLSRLQRCLTQLSPQGVANALWGLARSHTSVPNSWMGTFAEVTRPQLPTYSPLVLSTLLYSLAALHHSLTDPPHAHHSTSPGRDALSREHQSTHPSPHTSPSRDVHNRDQPAQPTQQHSDSREQSTHPSPHTSPSRDTHSREQSSRDARTPLSRWVADAQSALLCCMPECTPRITATLWYSFGRLQLLPEPALLQALLAHSQSQLPTMEPQGLANTAWAVSRLGVVPDPVWLAVLLEQTSAKMADMSAQELSNVASGLARLGARPDAAWLTTLTQASTQAMPSSNSHNLSSMALALVAFRHSPSLDWQQAFARRLHECMGSLTYLQKVHILQSIIQLALPFPHSLVSQLSASATSDVTLIRMDKSSVSLLLAMVALRMPVSGQWLELFAGEVLAHAHQIPEPQLADIASAFASTGYQPTPSLLASVDDQMLRHTLPQLHTSRASPVSHQSQQQLQQHAQQLEQELVQEQLVQQQQQEMLQQMQQEQDAEEELQQQAERDRQQQPSKMHTQLRPWHQTRGAQLLQPPVRPELPVQQEAQQSKQGRQQEVQLEIRQQEQHSYQQPSLSSPVLPSPPMMVTAVPHEARLQALCAYVSVRLSFKLALPSSSWVAGAQQVLGSPSAVQVLSADARLRAMSVLTRLGRTS